MTYEVLTIPGPTANPLPVASQGESPCLLFNPSTTNNVWISDNQSFSVNQQRNDAIPIRPLGSIVITNADSDTFAQTDGPAIQIQKSPALQSTPAPSDIALELVAAGLATASNQTSQITHESNIETNTGGFGALGYLGGTLTGALVGTAGLTISKDMLHANTGVTTEIAALIASGSASGTPGGVPLLNGTSSLGSGNAISLPSGGGFTTEGPFTITQPGYELYVSLAYAIAAPGGSPTTVTLIWRDSVTLDHIETEQFVLFPGASTGNAHIMTFKGPSKTSQVLIQFSNSDTLSAVTMSYVFWQNSRVLPRSIGKTIQIPTQFAASTYFSAFGNPSRNVIGEYTNASLAAATTIFIITSVYNGDCDLMLCSGSGVNPPLSIQGYPVDAVNIAPPLYNAYQQTNSGIHEVVSLSRAEMVWAIKNNDTVNAHAVNFALIAKEQGT